MNSTHFGYLLTILSALAFASLSLFAKLAFDAGVSAWSLTFINSAAALVLLGAMYARERRPQWSALRQNWVRLVIFGLCGVGGTLAFNLALAHLSISLATILLFTYPAFTALFSWLVNGQRPSLFHTLALLLTVAGAVFTADLSEAFSGTISVIGIALALLTAVSHALYIVLGERVAHLLSPVGATTWTRLMILLCTVGINPTFLPELAHVSTSGWIICILSTVVAGIAPFLFLNKGIALIGANRAAIASVAELPFALALGLLFRGDRILLLQWMGAALITVAVIISQRRSEGAIHDGSGTGAT